MFKLQPDPVFPFTAHISVPGLAEPQPLQLIGKHMGRKELAEFQASLVRVVPTTNADGTTGPDRVMPSDLTDQQVVARIVAGWADGQVDEPFSPEAINRLLDGYQHAAGEIYAAWLAELTSAREKN